MSEDRWRQSLSPVREIDPGASTTLGSAQISGSRTTYQRDFDRIVFSSAFRRLHDKTQVFPLPEDDQVHSRLTHSLEVSCVGRSLGTRVGEVVLEQVPSLQQMLGARDIGDIVAAACLAHDIGNPPFGHAGEDAIGRWFQDHRSTVREFLTAKEYDDFAHFEGNAQGFRILTRLEMPAQPGLRLTAATLGAFCKYPREAGPRRKPSMACSKKHGVFQSEMPAFLRLADLLGLTNLSYAQDGREVRSFARHPLAYLVEAADDICYSILDLEDGFHLGMVGFEEVRELFSGIAAKDSSFRNHQEGWSTTETISYLRAKAIGRLVDECVDVFLASSSDWWSGAMPSLCSQIPSKRERERIEKVSIDSCYQARDVIEIELAGYEVLSAFLDQLVPAALALDGERDLHQREKRFMKLLPNPPIFTETVYQRLLRVTDWLSGLTDSGAMGLFRKLRGVSLASRRWV